MVLEEPWCETPVAAVPLALLRAVGPSLGCCIDPQPISLHSETHFSSLLGALSSAYLLLPGHDLRQAILRTQLMHSNQALVLTGILHAGGHHCTPGGPFSVQLCRLVISSHSNVSVPERKQSVMSLHQKQWCCFFFSHSPLPMWLSPPKATTGGKDSLCCICLK